MTTKEILIAARDLISDRKRWTHGANARDARGKQRSVWDEKAVRFCARGAITKVALDETVHRRDAVRKLENVLEKGVVVTNDLPVKEGGGYKKIMEGFDRAIESLKD